MAITRWDKHWNGATGRHGASGASYSAVYRAWTDDPLDNAETIVDYVLTTAGFSIGDEYAYGNDADADSYLASIEPRRLSESNIMWEVVLNYEPVTEEQSQQPDSNGDPSSDPTDWRDSIDESSFTATLPVEYAIYRGGMEGNAHVERKIDTIGPVTNSAGMPFVPGLVREAEVTVVTRQFYSLTSADSEALRAYIGTVNLIPYNVDRPDLSYSRRWDKYTARIKKVAASFRRVNNFDVWQNTIEIWVQGWGWRAKLVDRGRFRRAFPGDPDGSGGTVTGSIPTISTGKVWVTPILDPLTQEPIADDVLLDGDGQPKRPYQDPFYITYSVYPEKDLPRLLMHHD